MMFDLSKHTHHEHVKNTDYPTTVLWITFIIMAASAVGFAIVAASKPLKLRAHAYLAAAIVTIAASSYYALATNSGKVAVLTGFGDHAGLRDVYYARYIDWTFTTPLLLLTILLIAGAPFGVAAWILFFDVLMIVLGLVGALTVGHFKWGYFIIACFFQAFITYGILVPVLQSARARNPILVRPYLSYAGFLGLVWIGYPIVWAISEGTNLITSRDEAGAYALLDIIAKPIFGWIVVLGSGPLHQVQLEEEKQSSSYVQPLTTPIGDIWGTPSTSTGLSGDGAQEYAPLTGEA